jgi:hypothetical protein
MEKKKVTIEEIKGIIDDAIEDHGVTVVSVDQTKDGEYCSVVLEGDMGIGSLNAIVDAVGDDPIISGEEYDRINLFFRMPDEGETGKGSGTSKLHTGAVTAPAIPDYLRHRDRFYDSVDVVIPGTEKNYGNTDQRDRVMAWMRETNHIPIMCIRLEDGVHAEISDIYARKVRYVLERGEAVAGDGSKYTIEEPGNIFPIGDSICVRATCTETGRSDIYGLDFFV